MAISGITTTANNGVERITNVQTITGTGTADGETLVLDGSTSTLEASGSGSVVVTNSQIKLDADTGTGNDASAPINYGARATTTTEVAFRDTMIIAGPYTARHNILVTELTRVKVIESDLTGYLFVYTSTDSILDDVLFRGINVWEVYAAPAVAFGITVTDVNYGYLNWEAGRLDFFGFAVADIVVATFWHGTGATNYSYHWNPDPSVNFETLYLTQAAGGVYEGYTATWVWRDRDSGSAVEDVLLIFRDDRSGSSAEQGRFVTNANGRLSGTFDSQFDTTGSDIERPTLFMLVNQITNIDTGNPGAYTYPVAVIGGDQGNRQENYDIDAVTPELELRSYAHEAVTGFGPADTFTPTEEIGSIASDLSINRYSEFLLVPDSGITVAQTVADAYTGLGNLEQLFDRTKSEWRDNDDYPLPVRDGTIIDLGSTDLVIDGDATSAFAYSAGTITIDTSTTSASPITEVGTATEAISTGEDDEITISFPTGIQDDDVAYIIVGHAQSDENAWNTPSGWTIPTGLTEVQTGGTPASVPGVSVFRRVLSSDSGSVTITNAGTNTSGIVAQMRVFRNVNTTTPEDVNPTTASGSTGDPNPPSITPTNDGSMILAIGFQDDGDQTSPTAPSGYSSLVDTATTDGAGGGE